MSNKDSTNYASTLVGNDGVQLPNRYYENEQHDVDRAPNSSDSKLKSQSLNESKKSFASHRAGLEEDKGDEGADSLTLRRIDEESDMPQRQRTDASNSQDVDSMLSAKAASRTLQLHKSPPEPIKGSTNHPSTVPAVGSTKLPPPPKESIMMQRDVYSNEDVRTRYRQARNDNEPSSSSPLATLDYDGGGAHGSDGRAADTSRHGQSSVPFSATGTSSTGSPPPIGRDTRVGAIAMRGPTPSMVMMDGDLEVGNSTGARSQVRLMEDAVVTRRPTTTRRNAPTSSPSTTRVGAHAIPGPDGSIVVGDQNVESAYAASDVSAGEVHLVEAVTREEMARQLHQQMRSEMQQELQANIITAQVIQEEQPIFWTKRRILIAVGLSLIVVIAILVGAVLASTRPDDEPSVPPNPPNVTIAGLGKDDRGDDFGDHIAMSADGSTLAGIATDGNYVQVYRKTNSTSWSQIGQDLVAAYDVERKYEARVGLNKDGSVVVVGREDSDEAAKDAGEVTVHWFNGTMWNQVGQTLFGTASEDHFGYSVAISDDGLTAGVGAELGDPSSDLVDAGYVKVFAYNGTLTENNGQWIQLGSTLMGELRQDQFGRTVALSSNGRRVAVSAAAVRGGARKGQVRVFDYSDSAWNQVGQSLEGDNDEDKGDVVDISSNGTILAISFDGADVDGRNGTGLIRVFRLEGCCAWKQHGLDIIGEGGGFGNDFISLSGDGTCVATGSRSKDTAAGTDAGLGNLFQWSNSQWNKIATVRGKEYDKFGTSVAVSGNCSSFAFGAPQSNVAGNPPGYISVYNVDDLLD